MSTEKINKLFWLNYAQAIKDKAKANFGPSGVFFIGSEVQKGPLAGDGIPDEYTNQALYNFGNNLLATDNLFYNPSALHGYAQALQLYLSWVDLEAKPNPTENLNLFKAREAQKKYQIAYDTSRDAAAARFAKDAALGLTNGLKFGDWVDNGHAPGYTAARDQLTQIGITIKDIQSRIGGKVALVVDKARTELEKGLNVEKSFVGYNMQAAVGNVLSTDELLNHQAGGDPLPTPPTHFVPYYESAAYKKFVQDAQTRSGGKYEPTDSVDIKIDTQSDTSDFNFGQTSAGANVGFSYGWLGFSAGGSGSESSTTFETGSDASSVRIKLLFDRVEAVTINPGSWNVNVSQFKLQSDAPKELKELVRPSQLIVASSFGYEISFGNTLASSFDSQYKKTVSAGGSINILGFPISLGASGSSTTEKNTHQAHWDSASKTLKVQPKDDVQTATVLGIVGEKFSIL